MNRETRLEKVIWMKCALKVAGCILLIAGCAHLQTESQSVSESPTASQMQAASEVAPTTPSAKGEEAAPKRTESARINGLQVKEKPEKNSRTVAVVKKGDLVEIKGESGKWVNVITQEGQDGWVASSGLTGFVETDKPQASPPAQTPAKTKAAVKPSVSPVKTDPAPKVNDSTPAPPRVSDSDIPPKAPVSDAEVKPKVSDSE